MPPVPPHSYATATKRCPIGPMSDWISAVMSFKRLFHIGYERLRPLLATILCIWDILVDRRVGLYNVSRISHVSQKQTITEKKLKNSRKKARHRTNF